MKKIIKTILVYVIALVAGIALWIILTPYAKAYRADPSLVGGECLMPIYTVGGVAVVRQIKRERRENDGRGD